MFVFVFVFFPVFVFVLVFVPVFVPVFARSQVAAGGSKCVRGNWGVCSEFCLKFVFGPKQHSVPCIKDTLSWSATSCAASADLSMMSMAYHHYSFYLNNCSTIGPIISFL